MLRDGKKDRESIRKTLNRGLTALTGLLRGELGFTGVIVSDGLEMRAVSEPFGMPAAAVLADAANFPLPFRPGDRRAHGRPIRVTVPSEYPPSTQPTALPQKVE